MELAEAGIFDEATYLAALADDPRLGGAEGIDATLAANDLDCIVAPTNSPAWSTDLINGDAFLFGSSGLAAVAGYPLVTVTGGFAFGLPVGLTFMASAWSEPTLIEIASGYEAAAGVNQRPRFLETFSGDEAQPGSGPGSRATAGSHRAIGLRASRTMQRQIAAQRLMKTKVWRPAGL